MWAALQQRCRTSRVRRRRVRRVSIDAGHCPQDEAPRQVNAGLMAFAAELGA